MTDDLYARLRAADPVPAGTAVEPADSDGTRISMEAAMSTKSPDSLRSGSTATSSATGPRSRWFPLGIAAAAAGVIVAGSLLVPALFSDDQATVPAAVMLSLPADNASMSCAPITPDILSAQELAFAGTATTVTDTTVILTVDSWYRGGADATEVELGSGPTLPGYSIDFQEGQDYLISATGGTVATCGLSGEQSPELQALFSDAFNS